MEKRKSIIEWMDDNLPPFFCFAMSRKYARGPWAGPVLIAKRAGLTHRTVTRIGGKISWEGVDVDVMSAFVSACGFEITKWGLVVLNKTNSYKRYMATKAVRPMYHMNDFQWRLFNKRCTSWMKLRKDQMVEAK